MRLVFSEAPGAAAAQRSIRSRGTSDVTKAKGPRPAAGSANTGLPMTRIALAATLAGLIAAGPAFAQGWYEPYGHGYDGPARAGRARPVPESHPRTAYPETDYYGRPVPGRRGAVGGGFIEYLYEGGEPPPPPRGTRVVPRGAPSPYADIEGRVVPLRRMGRMPDFNDMPVEPGAPRGMHPRFLPQVVRYQTSQRPGTIVIDTRERFLYLVEAGGTARRYGVGVGRPGFGWTGSKVITRKAEWPDWRPPADMLRRRPDLPRFMAGGPDNPLGARALYLGSSLYRIHGSNEPHTIGTYVSSGCFRMRNEDVVDLYQRVRVGTRVVVM